MFERKLKGRGDDDDDDKEKSEDDELQWTYQTSSPYWPVCTDLTLRFTGGKAPYTLTAEWYNEPNQVRATQQNIVSELEEESFTWTGENIRIENGNRIMSDRHSPMYAQSRHR